MKLAMQKLLSQEKWKRFNFFPSAVKNFFQIATAVTYNHKKMSLSISNSGPAAIKKYIHLYCKHCKKILIPKILEAQQDALGEDATLLNLIGMWVILKMPEDKIYPIIF